MITTEDEATIFVNLLNPTEPDYEIANKTDHTLTVRQKGSFLSEPVTIKPYSKIPYIFDDML
jgi:hypothetical protein